MFFIYIFFLFSTVIYTSHFYGFVSVGRGGGVHDFFSLKCHALCPICLTFFVVHFSTFIFVSIFILCLKLHMRKNYWYNIAFIEVGTSSRRIEYPSPGQLSINHATQWIDEKSINTGNLNKLFEHNKYSIVRYCYHLLGLNLWKSLIYQ